MKKITNTEHTTFDDIWNDDSLVSQDDRHRIQFAVDLIGTLIQAREEKGLTQEELAELAHVKQSAIARLESMKHKPQIDTLHKLLLPLGKKLAIVDI